MILCPFSSKKRKNVSRTSSLVIIIYDFSVTYTAVNERKLRRLLISKNSSTEHGGIIAKLGRDYAHCLSC